MAMGYPTKKKPIYDGHTLFIPFENRYMVSYTGINGKDMKYKKITFRECEKLQESFGEKWTQLDWRIRVYADEMKNGRLKSGKFHIYLNEDKGYALEFPGYIMQMGYKYKIGCHIKHFDDFEPYECDNLEFDLVKATSEITYPKSKYSKYRIIAKVSINEMKVVGFKIVGEA